MRAFVIAAVLALSASPALAQDSASTSLTLANTNSAPARTIIDGATWRCDDGVCVASGGSEQPALRACRRVVARLGAVSAFSWRGQALGADELAQCNTAAAA